MITLRYNQVEAVDAVEDGFRAGLKRVLVTSCVGSGKSLGMAEQARRAIARGERAIIGAHTRELVEQNAAACRLLGLNVGINAEALGQRTWRAPVISASIQSIYSNAMSFGPIENLMVDECDLMPHSEAGMYHKLHRGLGYPRLSGWTGTDFRLNGGSLVEGEGAPFDKVVYRYEILDGIRDGYLVPAFSAEASDKMDPTKLRTRQGEYTGDSQDAQMLAAIDNHVAQMLVHGAGRRSWLIFEASTKAAHAMCERMNQWGIPTGLVLGTTPAAERARSIADYRSGRLRALVNVNALAVGFDVQETDLLVMRRRTKSLRFYIQMIGRGLRTIGGNIEASIRAGKMDCLVLDFAGNIDQHGALDMIRPKESKVKMVSCESCGKRNPSAAARCWSCDDPMTKLCPACLETVDKGVLDCPHCKYDMRVGVRDEAAPVRLLDRPSGAALIAAYKTGTERNGGWLPILRVFGREEGQITVVAGTERYELTGTFAEHVRAARWLRVDESGTVTAVMVPNGLSRKTAVQIMLNGTSLVVPLPGAREDAA